MDLIAKKELLSLTGISYGQLYRWKRENLIPEEWFIKQASSTGQETFFPRDQIVSRVTAILDLKDTHSLDELAQLFLGKEDKGIPSEELRSNGFFADELIEILLQNSESGHFTLAQVTLAHALWTFGSGQGLPPASIASLITKTLPLLAEISVYESLCTLLHLDKKYHVCLSRGTIPPVFSQDVKVLGSIPLADVVETIRSAITGGK